MKNNENENNKGNEKTLEEKLHDMELQMEAMNKVMDQAATELKKKNDELDEVKKMNYVLTMKLKGEPETTPEKSWDWFMKRFMERR